MFQQDPRPEPSRARLMVGAPKQADPGRRGPRRQHAVVGPESDLSETGIFCHLAFVLAYSFTALPPLTSRPANPPTWKASSRQAGWGSKYSSHQQSNVAQPPHELLGPPVKTATRQGTNKHFATGVAPCATWLSTFEGCIVARNKTLTSVQRTCL